MRKRGFLSKQIGELSDIYKVLLAVVCAGFAVIGIFSYSFYLNDFSRNFAELFRLQNLNLIESSNSLELCNGLEALKSSGAISCIKGSLNQNVFYKTGSEPCTGGPFTRIQSINAVGNPNFQVQIGVHLPFSVQIAFLGFLSLNLSVFVLAFNWLRFHEKIKQESQERMNALAKQVAHDVRSPLSALNLVVETFKEIPEDRRLILRNAVQRINDIANDLLTKSKTNSQNPAGKASVVKTEIIMLPSIIDSIVSEKRTQYREKMQIRIETDLSGAFGAFSKANSKDLKRIISNLVNNSVEAMFNASGKIIVGVNKQKDFNIIFIKDNGQGIPPEILKNLGQPGVSHGKQSDPSGSGNGLGVSHAKATVESWGGHLSISSKPGVGTTFELAIPSVEAPKWFQGEITIQEESTVVILDDDLSIHNIWTDRFRNFDLNYKTDVLVHLTSAKKFSLLEPKENMIFLIDFELLGQNKNGLDLIIEKGIQAHSALVTSHYEDPKVLEAALAQNVKILPKSLASIVPIKFSKKRT